MSRRAVLWVAFVLVHLVVAIAGFALPNQPMGDLYFVYEPWSLDALQGRGIAGIASEWVYPQLALVPMVLAHSLEWIAGYEVAWALMVTGFDALAFGLLVGRGRSAGRAAAASFWLAYALLLGPIGMYRIDAVTVPLAIAACLWLAGRPLLASVLLAVATWIKVWPAALLAAAFIAVRRRMAIAGGALLVTAVTVWSVIALGGATHVLGFVAGQTGRGVQFEAPVAMYHVWRAALGLGDSFLYYDDEFLTVQVTGPGIDAVIAVMTPLLLLAVAAIAAVGAMKAWRGASFVALFPPLSLSLVLALIALNKVGSPQFVTWIIAPIAFGLVLDRRRWWPIAIAALGLALLTQLGYPLLYGELMGARPAAVAVLTVRNLLTVALFVWAIVRLVRVPRRSRHPLVTPAPSKPPAPSNPEVP